MSKPVWPCTRTLHDFGRDLYAGYSHLAGRTDRRLAGGAPRLPVRKSRPGSDFDIAVLVDDSSAMGASGVNRAIRRLGGDVPAQLLDIVLLNNVPPLLRHRVLRDGVLLHMRSKEERVRFAIRAIRDYQDIEPRLSEHTRHRVRRLKEGSGMVDREIFSRRLGASHIYLARATRLGEVEEAEFTATPDIHDLAERYLQLVVEAAIVLTNNWIAEEGLRTPDTNRDTFAMIEEAGEIDATLAERLRGWAGLRNVLVHQYATIDHRLAYRAICDDLGDLVAFRQWILDKVPLDRANAGDCALRCAEPSILRLVPLRVGLPGSQAAPRFASASSCCITQPHYAGNMQGIRRASAAARRIPFQTDPLPARRPPAGPTRTLRVSTISNPGQCPRSPRSAGATPAALRRTAGDRPA